jgi:hypothetical protein
MVMGWVDFSNVKIIREMDFAGPLAGCGKMQQVEEKASFRG